MNQSFDGLIGFCGGILTMYSKDQPIVSFTSWRIDTHRQHKYIWDYIPIDTT